MIVMVTLAKSRCSASIAVVAHSHFGTFRIASVRSLDREDLEILLALLPPSRLDQQSAV